MFKIGEFSKLAMVTIKALRFYDEEDILKPQLVDAYTNYRFYSSEQLTDIHRIVSLRQAGLSIAEIKEYARGRDLNEIIADRRVKLERSLIETAEQLQRLTHIINSLKEDKTMSFQATVKDIPSYHVFYGVKKLTDYSEMTAFITNLGAECQENNPTLKCVYPEYCYVTYLDEEYTPVNTTVMYAQAIQSLGKESENVKFKTIPAVTVVSVMVKGDYAEHLPPAYAFIVQWIKENGFEIIDKSREVYIDGCWNEKRPEEYLTEIQIPVKKL